MKIQASLVGAYGSNETWKKICEIAQNTNIGDNVSARQFFERNFLPYSVNSNSDRSGLFTGYFEPELNGSMHKTDVYNTPLYARPNDLVTVSLGNFRESLRGTHLSGQVIDGELKPYPTREIIEKGYLRGRDLEIVWVDNRLDAFFLHIQGSGKIRFEDGETRRIAYAAKNGRPYFPIGRALVTKV